MKLRSIRLGFFLAIKTLRRGQKGLLITPVLVMAVTFINLLFIPGIIIGAVIANKDKLTQTLVSDYIIQPSPNEENIANVKDKITSIQQLSGVQAVTSVLQVGNRISSGNNGGYWTVLAVDEQSYKSVFSNNIQSGTFLDSPNERQIVLGVRISGYNKSTDSSSLGGVAVDSPVKVLLYGHGDQEFNVSGIFDNSFYDSDVRAYISRAYYEKIDLNSGNYASKIFIKTGDLNLQDEEIQKLQTIVGNAEIINTDESSSGFEEQAETYSDIGKLIGIMAVFVAATVIFIVTYVDLLQRRRQIGIQRAIGIHNTAIVTSYIFRAIINTVLGIILGAVIYRFGIVAYFDRNPLVLRNGEVRLVTTGIQYFNYALLLTFVALLSAIIPALKEVKLKLLEAIWGSN